MAQFDVFRNPIVTMRHAYPFVVALQSAFASDARTQIVAPLVPRELMPNGASRLTPVVALEGSEYILLVPALTGMQARDLRQCRCSIAAARSEVLTAVDYLFFGV